MSFSGRYVPLPGSDRAPLPGARRVGEVDPSEPIEVTLILRPRQQLTAAHDFDQVGAAPPAGRRHLTREELATQYGASDDDIAAVQAFAAAHGLSIGAVDAAQRRMVLGGSAAAMKDAFQVDLGQYEAPGVRYRGREGEIQVPEELRDVLVAVLGLDNRPAARPHYRLRAQAATGQELTPVQVARHYNFPQDLDGSGQSIAIIELGGGFRVSDLTTYFREIGVTPGPVTAVSVDGGHNHPGKPNSADGEVMLDVEVIASIATGASIAVYFAPNTTRGFVDAVSAAVHDTVRRPSVVSISWGSAEEANPAQLRDALGSVLQAAAAVGVTVCCASGDDGSRDNTTDGRAHVDFPASHPFSLGCGGTSLAGPTEVAWNDGPTGGVTGGGVSELYPLPSWQANAGVPLNVNDQFRGRGVPDIAANADPQSGYRIRVDRVEMPIGGTSAVAPLMSALIAMANQKLGRPVGFINPRLYGSLASTAAFHDITSGDNGAYQAGPGWDPCTGLGSPDGVQFVNALTVPAVTTTA